MLACLKDKFLVFYDFEFFNWQIFLILEDYSKWGYEYLHYLKIWSCIMSTSYKELFFIVGWAGVWFCSAALFTVQVHYLFLHFTVGKIQIQNYTLLFVWGFLSTIVTNGLCQTNMIFAFDFNWSGITDCTILYRTFESYFFIIIEE